MQRAASIEGLAVEERHCPATLHKLCALVLFLKLPTGVRSPQAEVFLAGLLDAMEAFSRVKTAPARHDSSALARQIEDQER